MARIPDELVERIRDTADLLEIVQESVQLKRQGSDWRGPCPFHGGTNRNFAVIPKKNLYYCFVCHASGDVFTWYRERFGLDYPSAVREVARRYGIVIPEATERQGPDPREPLYQACDAAQSWFAARLRDGADAEPARRYLLDREFSLDAAAELGLGWAPRGDDFLVAMRALGIPEAVLEEAALIQRREDGSWFPRFRQRLLFPIHDLRGRPVGFGGRLIGPGEPKYLNSPETPIFHKGEQLYHLHLAKHAIRKAEHAIVVEGYFDVQRLAIAGIEQVVAPLGTALTDAQAALLKRYTGDVILLYDSDAPGLKATFRAADALLAHGVRARVATMPEGEDPDTLVRRGGAAALQPILDDAVDVLERKLGLLERKGWFSDVGRAREALDRLLPTLRAASDPVMQALYVSRVAERLGIPRETVATEAATKPAPVPMLPPDRQGAGQGGGPGAPPRQRRDDGAAARPRTRTAEIERKLLRLLLLDPVWLARAQEELLPDRFLVPTFRRIYEAVAALEPGVPAGEALAALDERAREVWSQLVVDGPRVDGFDADREYAGALAALEEQHTFDEIAAEPDPVERRRRRLALSSEGQRRFEYYLKSRPARPDSAPPPPEEYA